MDKSSSSSEFRREQSFRRRLYFFMGVIVFSLVMIVMQLINLQLVNGQENALKAEKFVRKSESLPASRGHFYDRNFLTPETTAPLVSNSDSLDAVVNTTLLRNNHDKIKSYIKLFAKTLSIPLAYYEDEIEGQKLIKKIRSKQPIVLLEGITREQQERISVFDNIARYIIFTPSPRRIYNMGPALAHISGYVGKPSKEDLQNKEVRSYQLVGKVGIEQEYDDVLRGTDGLRIQKRNSDGNIEEDRVVEHALPGDNLILTIDKNVQIAAYKALKNIRGTVIAIKPSTGEIIAMASNPSYDPNILAGKNRQDRQVHFNKVKKNKGFLNLALQSKFPPASTFKILVALAALESEHKVEFNPSVSFPCNGRYMLKSSYSGLPDQEFKCWDKRGHGTNDLTHAIEKSCSVYFYNLGYKLGSESILSYARLFGLDKKSNIDLQGEITGFIPSNEWKKRTFGSKWFDGDTINLSIGQGFVSVTPMGMALFFMAIINNGKIYQPFIVQEIRSPIDNSIKHRTIPKVIRDIPIKKSTIDSLKQGLRAVCRTGTASRVLNIQNLPEIAGKTGTAQTRRRGSSGSNHAWFIGYGPFHSPPEEQILVAVFLEYGVGGAAGAGPVARDVFKAAFPPGSFKRVESAGGVMDEEAPQEGEYEDAR